ncbi:MAG: hypothetical protein AMJ81_07150 [Phycisphaerae bacterium SM23_33]|nr:MAG: hypothetical protein AMJ81_07150 [Phycisphaerae bacterium SM23_33]
MSQAAEWHPQQWARPESTYRGAPFWSWNDRLVPERLCRQIEQMHRAGMGGFFMHSRYGLKTPYLSQEWFDCVSACVEKARQLDMKAYLYDEDRWPSGAAGGLVTREHPEFAAHLLVAIRGPRPPAGMERLASFAVRFDDSGRCAAYRALEEGQGLEADEVMVSFAAGVSQPSPWFNEAPYLDTLSAEAVAEFIRVTHQAYADRYGNDFGGVIPAIFTDEPNYSHSHVSAAADELLASLPWTAKLAMEFKRRRGYDLRDHLVELAFPAAGSGAYEFSKLRHDYWRTATELFGENFSAQIGRWCDKHSIALTGHYLGEESLTSQIRTVGSAMPHYAHQQWPGVDILTDQRHEIGTVKQCCSVAAQLGRARVLSELYGCTGWDWPLEGHKFNGGWQYVLGVNLRCPHLSLYSLAGGAKRDYPASIFPQSPWWKYYRVVEDYFARLGLLLTKGKPVRDVLMIHPIESAYGLYLPGEAASTARLQEPFTALLAGLLDHHYDYDLGDESLLAARGKVAAGKLKLGKMDYRLVVVPPAITLRSTTAALLKRFLAAGGSVVFVEPLPQRLDGEPSEELAQLIAQATRCGARPSVVAATIETLLPRRVSVTENGAEAAFAWTMLRHVRGGQVLFLQSCDRTHAHDVRVSVQGRRPVVLMDPATGARRRVEAEKVGDRVEFALHLPQTGSALVSLGLRAGEAAPPAAPPKVAAAVEAPGPWKVERLEPNSFPLDYCRFRIGEGESSEPVPVLLAEEKIRAHWGLPRRLNQGCQPWYLAETNRADRTVRGRCEMKFQFHVTDVPGRLQLAIERPEDFQILLNGQAVASEPTGCWVDEDIKTVDISPAVRAGHNELLLRFDYRSDMELEDLHLVGEFAVRRTGDRRTFDAHTLTRPPTELAHGSWVGQGLDFYGGAVMYRIPVDGSVRQAAARGKRVRLAMPAVRCTCAAVHVGERTFVLAWPPMAADITEPLAAGGDVAIEIIGGRKNILGPLHVPWLPWTGPGEFDPHHPQWTDEYLLNDHGLMAAPVFEILE